MEKLDFFSKIEITFGIDHLLIEITKVFHSLLNSISCKTLKKSYQFLNATMHESETVQKSHLLCDALNELI